MGTAIIALGFFMRLLTLDPMDGTKAGVRLAGHPEFEQELVGICKRESPGSDCARRVGVHGNNRVQDVESAYRKAISLKYLYLHPGCPEHKLDPDPRTGRPPPKELLRFGVRGNHGLMAAYSVRFLGPCVAPEALDIPVLSAIAATRRAVHMCLKSSKCSTSERLGLWIGVSLESKRLEGKTRVRDLCGRSHP